MRAPKLPGRGLAPTSATDRACSIAATASVAVVMVNRSYGPARQRRLHTLRLAFAIGKCGARSLPTGYAADAAAGVRRGAAVVEPGDRGAVVGVSGRGTHVEQLLERELTVEDVTSHQAVLDLHLVRSDDVA